MCTPPQALRPNRHCTHPTPASRQHVHTCTRQRHQPPPAGFTISYLRNAQPSTSTGFERPHTPTHKSAPETHNHHRWVTVDNVDAVDLRHGLQTAGSAMHLWISPRNHAYIHACVYINTYTAPPQPHACDRRHRLSGVPLHRRHRRAVSCGVSAHVSGSLLGPSAAGCRGSCHECGAAGGGNAAIASAHPCTSTPPCTATRVNPAAQVRHRSPRTPRSRLCDFTTHRRTSYQEVRAA